jgi:hypothetical protein
VAIVYGMVKLSGVWQGQVLDIEMGQVVAHGLSGSIVSIILDLWKRYKQSLP